MAQRGLAPGVLDDFPTPPWAVRALCKYVLGPAAHGTCLEPAAGRGHMAATLAEYFDSVMSGDIEDYGWPLSWFVGDPRGSRSHMGDFIESDYIDGSFGWVITNPPFKLAEKFVLRALQIARFGVAMLCRGAFIETKGRYERLYSKHQPTCVAQFVERVPMVEGRLDPHASTATSYCWLVWQQNDLLKLWPADQKHVHLSIASQLVTSKLCWIPPCRADLELDSDYTQAPIDWPIRGKRT